MEYCHFHEFAFLQVIYLTLKKKKIVAESPFGGHQEAEKKLFFSSDPFLHDFSNFFLVKHINVTPLQKMWYDLLYPLILPS